MIVYEALTVGKRYRVKVVEPSSIITFIGRLNVTIMADTEEPRLYRLIFDCAEVNYTEDTTIQFEELKL